MLGAAPQAAEATHEQGGAEGEHPAASPAVAESGDGDEQGAEGEAVPGDDPLEAAVGGVELALHRGQRDVDDEEVEDDQERPAHEYGERRPAGVGSGGFHACVHGRDAAVSRRGRVKKLTLPLGESV